MMFATPAKTKGSEHMIAAFKRLFRQMPKLPETIFSDKGLEFQANQVLAMYRQSRIQKNVAQNPDVKAAIAERGIRTLKGRLYKFETFAETGRWIDVLPKIVNAINNTRCRTTGMRPVDVNQDNARELYDKLYGPSSGTATLRYDVGDKVRIAKQKKIFEKSYLPNFTQDVFEVTGVHDRRPGMYTLKDKDDEPVIGRFYGPELSKVRYNRDDKLIVQKVVDTRTRRGVPEYFVKWRGKPAAHNTWITEADLL